MSPKEITNRADEQKNRFGGSPFRNGRTLTAEVKEVAGEKEWFRIRLRVFPDPGAPPITGSVTFYLHQTFKNNKQTVRARDGEAKLVVYAYGAFTVGAVLDGGDTELELDMAELANAPKKFRDN